MRRIRLKLGVNIDHVATLRQVRGTEYPDLVAAARVCERAGADGITVHLREDRRHIQEEDVRALRRVLRVPLNLELANSPAIIRIALKVRPAEVCMVPERRRELTTEGGLDVVAGGRKLQRAVQALAGGGIEVSLFIDPDRDQVMASRDAGAPFVELHTGALCDAGDRPTIRRELRRLVAAAETADRCGLRVNAGHGINLNNLPLILRIPHLHTLNIGHSIVCRSVFVGLRQAVREMRAGMASYAGSS